MPITRPLITGNESAASSSFISLLNYLQTETIKRARSSCHRSEKGEAVIDPKDSYVNISTDLWQKVETVLIDSILSLQGSSEELSFKGTDRLKGVMIVKSGKKN